MTSLLQDVRVGQNLNQAQGDIVSGDKTIVNITDSTVHGPVAVAEQISNSFNVINNNYAEKADIPIEVDISHLPEPTTALIGRKTELAHLTEAFTNPNKRLAIIVAAGGIGKSALTDEWLKQIEAHNYYGKTRIFGWSFYSQGSHNTFTNSQPFFSAVLPFLGVTEIPKDEIEKARLLAKCLQQQPCLLILDGLEPLQYAQNLSAMNGEVQDSALKEFIACFRRTAGNSFVLLSSRQPLVELKKWQAEHYLSLDLKTLPHQDGADLLQALGVTGKAAERQAISKDLNGHALSLVLMGHLLVKHHQGDCRYANELPPLTSAHGDSDAEKDSRHALRVLDYYDSLQDAASRCFLQLLGLFDRPMNVDEKNALLQADFSQLPSKNPIKQLFGIKQPDYLAPLRKLDAKEWKQLEQRLEKSGLLLGKKGKTGYLEWDTHPIIRTYFSQKFKHKNPEAFKRAHKVLFDYYQNQPERVFGIYIINTLEEMQPLYHAILHGCLAEKYREAVAIYRKYILRGNEHYSWTKLGAYSQDLTALASFFPLGWEKLIQNNLLTLAEQASLLASASFCLMALGRLQEAIMPRLISMKLCENSYEWESASSDAKNLVDTHIVLGQLKAAQTISHMAIIYAQKSGYYFAQLSSLSYFAYILHFSGNMSEARNYFEQAEKVGIKHGNSKNLCLSSTYGFRYCAFLLDSANDEFTLNNIIHRAEFSLMIFADNPYLFDRPQDYLTLARAFLALNDISKSEYFFEKAILGIQNTHGNNLIPPFYLYRADFYLTQNQLDPAQADLNSAWEIIEHCGMKLYQVDYLLIHGRYCLATADFDTALNHYIEAKQLIQETGYHLRDAELDLFAAKLRQQCGDEYRSTNLALYSCAQHGLKLVI